MNWTTPGPWWADGLEVGAGPTMEIKVALVSGLNLEQAHANARLIAAAPELWGAAVELQAALKEESKERGGPWVTRPVSRDTQKRVALAHRALTAAIARAAEDSVPAPQHLTAEQIEKVDEAIAEALGDAYDCTRVWNAWRCGTMGPSDFVQVADDGERIAEIRNAVLQALGLKAEG